MSDPRPVASRLETRPAFVQRYRWVIALAALLLAAALAVPAVAFIIVPRFAKSTLVERLPSASAAAGAPSAPASTAASNPVLAKGELRRLDAVHFGSGTVLVTDLNGTRFLRFENVDIAGAPDMYVYLSDRADGKPGSFTNLGRLKATNGSFNYELPAGVDLAGVNSVVVWCRAFTVTITFAVLQKS